MNGKRAKAIRKRSADFLSALGIGLGEGYGEYEQLRNCVSWEFAKSPDGNFMKSPEGDYYRKPVLVDGTIKHKWKFKLFYKWLKRLYKAKDMDAYRLLNASDEELSRIAKLEIAKAVGGSDG